MLIKGIYNFCQIKNGEFLNSCHEKTEITKKITFIFLLIVSGRNPTLSCNLIGCVSGHFFMISDHGPKKISFLRFVI